MDAAPDEMALELRGLTQEFFIIGLRAKAHDTLDGRPVIPAAVEQHDLPSRYIQHLPLEKPLAAFDVARLFQSHDARAAGVHMLYKPFDGAAFAGRVAPLKQYDDPLPRLLHPRLELEQLCLQLKLLCFVVLA